MIGGVNFQPGTDPMAQQSGQSRPSSGSGVQEAIRVLSLRLPKVVGAQSAAPLPLLTSQGSGGNSRVDSIVNQVLSRIPGGQQQAFPTHTPPQQESMPTGPSFSGSVTPSYQPSQPQTPWTPPPNFNPRVIIGNPPNYDGPLPTPNNPYPGGQPPPFSDGNFPPATIAPLPNPWDRIGELLGGGGGGNAPSFETPLF